MSRRMAARRQGEGALAVHLRSETIFIRSDRNAGRRSLEWRVRTLCWHRELPGGSQAQQHLM